MTHENQTFLLGVDEDETIQKQIESFGRSRDYISKSKLKVVEMKTTPGQWRICNHQILGEVEWEEEVVI